MTSPSATFEQLALSAPLLHALDEVGYETPSPIQAASIPPLIAGRDLLGQAQTGTGKTAAFALPLLNKLNMATKQPEILVLTPTRELAIQVAEAFQSYARHLKGFHVAPIYGGQSMQTQLRQLKRGVHVVVGTPGRVMDHLRRKTLSLASLKSLVLDEADEMLRMGFIEDVEWILEHTPQERQIALFSATMPKEIRKVAQRYLNDPEEVKIKTSTTTVSTIKQLYWQVSGLHKLDALTRMLEVEDFDAAIIFVRTKTSTVQLAEKLEARGYNCAALNGDISQAMRERTVEQLKNNKLDIIVATDVAARGLDVKRITHVINYDIPSDTEAYVHRIGRTGRAGRKGNAILFVAPREMRMLRTIEKATNQPLERMHLPTNEAVTDRRIAQFKERIIEVIDNEDLGFFHDVVDQIQHDSDISQQQIAAALAYMAQKGRPLLYKESSKKDKKRKDESAKSREFKRDKAEHSTRFRDSTGRENPRFEKEKQGEKNYSEQAPKRKDTRHDKPHRLKNHPEIDMVSYRIEVGRNHEATPKDIVGAIANEAEIESQYIGHIKLYNEYSTIDLPDGMPMDIFQHLKKVRVRQHKLNISRLDAAKSDRKQSSGKKKPASKKKAKSFKKRSAK